MQFDKAKTVLLDPVSEAGQGLAVGRATDFYAPEYERTIAVALAAMHSGVACCAQRDQVLLGVVAGVAPKLFVMGFKVRHGTA